MSSISGISTGYLPSLSTPKKTNNATAVGSTPFGDLLSKQGLTVGNSSATALSKLTPADTAAPTSAAAEFQKYMEMSPAEKIRYSMLQDIGLTEDSLKALPPEEQKRIETAIANKIKEELQAGISANNTAAGTELAAQTNSGPTALFQAIQANNNNNRILDIYS